MNNAIDNVANKLVLELKSKRKECPTRPIVFIGHSLGGIVIEKTVIKAKLKGAEGLDIFNAIAGCVFLGTPFTGSPSQFKASLVAQVLEPMNLAKYNPFLKLLEEDSEVLKGLRDEFLSIVDQSNIATKNFYELQATNLNKFSQTSKWLTWSKWEELIAPRDIASFPGKDNISLNVDHSGLNKFASPSDPHWNTLRSAIKEVAE